MNTAASSLAGSAHAEGQAPQDIETAIRLRYFTLRTSIPAPQPITVLRIDADHIAIASGQGPQPNAVQALSIGSHKTAADYFKHIPPAADEIERAIMNVEDALASVRNMIVAGSTLFTTDKVIREIAVLAGLTEQPEMQLSREAIEQTYQRLAANSLGRPADGLPTTPEFAATLLILREFMHHMQFMSIAIRNS